MPHINVRHFPKVLTDQEKAELVSNLTQAISRAFQCSEGAISIALDPVEKESWNEQVYVPEIMSRADLLVKRPNY